jgi:hypothetical protein
MASSHDIRRRSSANERRAVEASCVKMRPSRNLGNLPNYFNDKQSVARQPRSCRYKNHRRP